MPLHPVSDYIDVLHTPFPRLFEGVGEIWDVLPRIAPFLKEWLEPSVEGIRAFEDDPLGLGLRFRLSPLWRPVACGPRPSPSAIATEDYDFFSWRNGQSQPITTWPWKAPADTWNNQNPGTSVHRSTPSRALKITFRPKAQSTTPGTPPRLPRAINLTAKYTPTLDDEESTANCQAIRQTEVDLIPVEFNVYPPEPTPEEIAEAGEDDWEIRSFQITADDPTIYVQAYFQVHGINSEGQPELMAVEDGSVVKWEIDPSSSPGAVLGALESTTEKGMASVLLTAPPTSRGKFKVQASVKKLIAKLGAPTSLPVIIENAGEISSAKCQFIEVLPGVANQIAVSRELQGGNGNNFPADGKSEMTFRAVIKDVNGNPVARGTKVYWHLKGSGTLLNAEEIVAQEDGSVTGTITAGNVPGNQTVTIEAEGCKHLETVVNHPVVFTQLSATPATVDTVSGTTTTVVAQFNNIAEGARISWSTSKGRLLEADETVEGNTAAAVLQATDTTTGDAVVIATVGGTSRLVRIPFTSSAPISVTVDRPVLTADVPADGMESVPSLIGPAQQVPYYHSTQVTVTAPSLAGQTVTLTAGASEAAHFFPFTQQVPYYHSTQVTVTAPSLAGQTVTLTAGASEAAHFFPFNQVTGTQSFDVAGLLAATFSGVSLSGPPQPVQSGAGAAYFPGGTAHVNIPDTTATQPTPGFDLAVWIYPTVQGGTIASKSGQYSVSMDGQGILTFTLGSAAGAVSVISPVSVPLNQWSLVTIERQNQKILLSVNETVQSAPAPVTTPGGTAPLLLGQGFTGSMDSLSLRSSAGASGVAYVQFDGGHQKQLNAQGQATFTLKASGQVPTTPGGKSISINAQVGSTQVTVKEAVQVVRKKEQAILIALAGHVSQFGYTGSTTATEAETCEHVASLCRAAMRSRQQSSAIPKTIGGDAGEKAQVGYRIAMFMEEHSDDAGVVGRLMKIVAVGGTQSHPVELPEEIMEMLNWQFSTIMIEARERGSDQAFLDFVKTNYAEFLEGLELLSTGDLDGFMKLAGAMDGAQSFDDSAAVSQGFGKEALSSLTQAIQNLDATWMPAKVKDALQRGFSWFNEEGRAKGREGQQKLLSILGDLSGGAEDLLRKAGENLHSTGVIDAQELSGFGFVVGVLQAAKEAGDEVLKADEAAEEITKLLGIAWTAAAGSGNEQQEAIATLKSMKDQVIVQVRDSPEIAGQYANQINLQWDQGNYFAAGIATGRAGAVVFTSAKVLKDFVLKASRRGVEYVRKKQTPELADRKKPGVSAKLGNKGEGWAKFRLRMKGYKNVIAIQNSSGHGIDLVCRDRRGNIVFVEVKSHFEALPLELRKSQSDMRNFARTRLVAARDKTGHWKNVDDVTSSNADSLLKAMIGPPPTPIRGIAINVDHAMTWFKKTTFYE